MKRVTICILAAAVALGCVSLAAAYYGASYTSWSYHPSRGYYWSQYRYRVGRGNYGYHYAIHYRRRPNYVYYYNPVRRVYWGRYDLAAKGYSELRPEDRRTELKDIPEEAFPVPGPLPKIDDAEEKDGRLDAPPVLPQRDPQDTD